ncbi:MAG TPA: tol-pal system protein YbgF [Thermoanaerobaculia bacterium]|nr:tol-pal system protein YbgF [Thermoanaerobaculia bacterium]
MRLAAAILGALALTACSASPPPQPAPTAAPPPAPDPRIAEMQVLLNELIDRLEVMSSRLQKLEAGALTPAFAPADESTERRPSAPRPVVIPSSAVIGDQYREALTLFGKGRLDDARAAFQRIFAADPSGDLADNALYWIGETFFVQARYPDAVAIYRRLVAEYPDQNKAPDALFKMGLSHVRLGDLAMARTTFQSLVDRYPYSTPAASARVELERIRY